MKSQWTEDKITEGGIEDLKVGDKVIRMVEGFRGEIWKYEGTVIAIDDNIVTCTVQVDITRLMRFWRETGINILGIEYGWIKGVYHE